MKILPNLDREKIRYHMRRRVRSREWWLIVASHPDGERVVREIRDRFYQGDASPDFEALLIPWPFWPPSTPARIQDDALIGWFFARKTRLAVVDLQAVLAQLGGIAPERISEKQDILFVGTNQREIIDGTFAIIE